MSFDSLVYLIFLVLVTTVYWQLKRQQQNIFLVAASWIFYGWWDWRFLLLIIFTTSADYFLGHQIARADHPRRKRQYLVLSLVMNLAVLITFKYFNFFTESLRFGLDGLGIHLDFPALRILLPIGISFYTFESIAYVVSIYRREITPARSFMDYALFIAFFPHLIAGPIMRPKHFLPQIYLERRFKWRRFINGLDLIVRGLVKKMVIADCMGYYVDRLFALSHPSTLLILVGGLGFAIQILADFMGYTDIARGSAKVLGFELARNFYRPYLSTSITQFWRQWHVSLSSWIRDYVYIPLGGSQVSRGKYLINIFLTWFICGLWHGAAWKYAAWGLYHGMLIAAERLSAKAKGPMALQRIRTFILVVLGWIIFRAPSLRDVRSYFSLDSLISSRGDFRIAYVILCILLFYSLPWIVKILWDRYRPKIHLTKINRWEIRALSYAMSVTLIFLFGKLYSNAFIYFQF